METLLDPGRRFVRKSFFVGEWVFISGQPSDGQNTIDFPVLHSTDHSECIPVTPRNSEQLDSLPWEPTKPQDKVYFWERIEAPPPFITATAYMQLHSSTTTAVPFLNVWN